MKLGRQNMIKNRLLVIIVALFISAIFLIPQSYSLSGEEYGKVEVIRDQWGIPNVFSDTDVGAMYGLGYATAEDRCFQMFYSLRTIQGRLAEVIGNVKSTNGNTTALDSDRSMRTYGFYRAAQKSAQSLKPESLALMQAYSDGVNRYLKDNANNLHYLFAKTGLKIESWTPADSIALWWNLGRLFANDGIGDTIAPDFKKLEQPQMRNAQPVVDDDSAVVRREDVSDKWIDDVNAFMEKHGLRKHDGSPTNPPKFSHVWVIGGEKTTTGSAIMVSDPQTPIFNPSLLYEFHISGKTFNVRGVGTAGCPMILIGFNKDVAWGMSALGADQADLFLLKTDSSHPNHYEYDGKWLDIKVRDETISVKDGNAETITIKETQQDPIVSGIMPRLQRGLEIAGKRIPICDTDQDMFSGSLEMMRSKDANSFLSAIAGWRYPSANVVFGDSKGNIGYSVIGALPIRSAKAIQWGDYAHDGSSSEWNWQGMIPQDLLPHVINPKQGYLVSANHRVIQSFYELPLGTSTGAFGETDRGLRIKERIKEHLAINDKFTPDDVLAIQYDSTNIGKRTILQLGYHTRDVLKGNLSEPSLNALKYLENWYKNGAKSDTSIIGTELTDGAGIMFRAGNTPLAKTYGGGDGGLASFAKSVSRRLKDNPKAELTADEISFADSMLSNMWNLTVRKYGADTNKDQLFEVGVLISLKGFIICRNI
jgi:penicillin amidase